MSLEQAKELFSSRKRSSLLESEIWSPSSGWSICGYSEGSKPGRFAT